jgi:hypothetical protein
MEDPETMHLNFITPIVRRMGRAAGVAGIAAAVTLTASSVARADLKIVSQTTVGDKATTTTTYYKGKKMRSETTDGQISIIDTATGKMYMLNVKEKTYQEMDMSALANNPMMQMMDIKSDVVVKPGGKTKTILGKPARNYVFTAKLTFNLKKEMLDRITAQNGGKKPPTMPPMPVISIQGENWVTDAIKMPGGVINPANLMQSMSPGMKNLVDKLSAIKGVPLESTQTVTTSGNAALSKMGPQVIKNVPRSLSEAPLSDSLFKVPAGFTKVTRPMGMPGRGVGGGVPRRPAAP